MSRFYPFAHRRLIVALLLVALVGLVGGLSISFAQEESPLATEMDPTPLVEWMTLLYDRIEVERISAPAASRMYAYAGVTAYEAVVNGIPGNYSIGGQVQGMNDLPLPEEGQVYDWASVANAALARVIEGLFPNPSQETLDAIQELYLSQAEARTKEVGASVVRRSLDYGDMLAEELNAWIAGDNFAETRTMEYTLPTGEGMWVPTTEGTNPAEPYWGQIRPFALGYADECAVNMNIDYSTDENSAFYAQAMEVKEVGENLTPEQQAIARWWVDTPAVSGTPAGHWVSIENQMVEHLDLPLSRAAEMYALVGMALGDAFISCWSLKYQYNLLRPETYIHDNIRRSWQPYIQTPPFPEYPSGHSVVSAAAAEVLTTMFGIVAFTDNTHVDEGEAPRSFTSFEAASTEAAISRLYGGIHFRTAIENGMRQGRCVGQRVLGYISLRPVPQGE
ncbi:MAG: vanadium-dependent haloperoxidase [bacterium]|nr:vanadium-dependent haloperoxidase [bacterium]